MKVCKICDKKYIRDDYYEKHMAEAHPITEAPPVENAEIPPQPEVVSVPPEPEKITLRFNRIVEVTINGVRYEGKIVEVFDFKVASEIVRIAREAYGPHVLEV